MVEEKEGCNFCNRSPEWIIGGSDNFYVTPSKGQIVEGYLLINTQQHFIGFSEMPSEMFDELERVKQRVKTALSREYTAPIFFEHGPITEFKRGGCCVEHAHIHCVPIDCDIFEEASRNFRPRRIENLVELRKQHERQMPYFYYENHSGEKYVFDVEFPVPSQYIRKLLAYKIGHPEKSFWQEYLGMEEFNRTLEKLRGKLNI